VSDVVVGGGGRYLILHHAAERELAIFDVNEARIVKQLPMTTDTIRIAAGMDKLIGVKPKESGIERWSLTTVQREAPGDYTMEVPREAMAVGGASNGPLVASGVDWPRLGETAFFNVQTLKRIPMDFGPHDFFETSPNVFLRASAEGRLFACQQQSGGARQACL